MPTGPRPTDSDPACPGDNDPARLDRVLAIAYYGRGGSVFLQSLFDSHPDVLTVPATYLTGFYHFWRRFGGLPATICIDAFMAHYEVLFDPCSSRPVFGVGPDVGRAYDFDRMGPARDERLAVDRDAFRTRLHGHVRRAVAAPGREPAPRRLFFQAVHAAYAAGLGQAFPRRRPLIVFQLHNPFLEEACDLFEDFAPAIRFLHCVREPVQTLASWFAHMRDNDPAVPGPTGDTSDALDAALSLPMRTIGRAIDHAKPVFAQYHDRAVHDGDVAKIVDWSVANSRAVRLEDLHRAPRATMAAVAAWAGLPWDDALLESTFGGKPWSWTTTGGKTVSGFQTATLGRRHRDVVAPLDRLRLRLLLADAYAAWGYPIPRVLSWLPLRRAAAVLWAIPFRMETRTWRRTGAWRPGRWYAAWRHYVALRYATLVRWRGDRRNRRPMIPLLERATPAAACLPASAGRAPIDQATADHVPVDHDMGTGAAWPVLSDGRRVA